MDNESTTTDAPAEVTDQQTLPTESNLENTSTQSETTGSRRDNSGGSREHSYLLDSDLDEWAAKTGRSAPTTDRGVSYTKRSATASVNTRVHGKVKLR